MTRRQDACHHHPKPSSRGHTAGHARHQSWHMHTLLAGASFLRTRLRPMPGSCSSLLTALLGREPGRAGCALERWLPCPCLCCSSLLLGPAGMLWAGAGSAASALQRLCGSAGEDLLAMEAPPAAGSARYSRPREMQQGMLPAMHIRTLFFSLPSDSSSKSRQGKALHCALEQAAMEGRTLQGGQGCSQQGGEGPRSLQHAACVLGVLHERCPGCRRAQGCSVTQHPQRAPAPSTAASA